MVNEAEQVAPAKSGKRPWFISLKEERLDRKLAVAFGFMSFIPILLIFAARVSGIDLDAALLVIIPSTFIGYFFIVRRTMRSIVTLTQKAQALTSGRLSGAIEITEQNEIGELARAFNRITQELEQKIEELESSRQLVKRLLARIGTAIVSYEGIDNLLNLIIENTTAALEAQMGSLMLVDGEKQELYVKTAWSANGQATDPGQRVKLGDGVVGWVAKEGQPLRVSSKATTLGFANGHSAEGAILCVPLKLRDKAIGVLSVLRENAARAFTEDDESLMVSIGSQVAVAIENYRLNLDVEQTYIETIMALALAVEAKDPYSAGHSKRVGYYAMQIGKALGLDDEMLRTLNDGGILHDIGKIGIKDEILLKPSHLSPDEEKIMQQHPVIGEAIVKPVRSLRRLAGLVRCHHERFDGSGYPSGLKGEQIPIGARILAVADTYDSMVTDRPYRKRLSIEEAKETLRKGAGVTYDPVVVEALLRILQEKEAHHASAQAASQSPPAA